MTEGTFTETSIDALVIPGIESQDSPTVWIDSGRPMPRSRPVTWDLALTMMTEFSVLVAGLALISLIGRLLGPVELGEYLLLRRVSAWLVAGILLGLANGLPRYIAYSVERPERERLAYFLVASLSLVAVVSSSGAILFLGRHAFARLLFGNVELAGLILPLVLYLEGMAAQTAVYGYYRGILAMGRANAIQFLHFALIPVVVVAVLYRTQSIPLIIGVTGVLTVLAALFFAWPIVSKLVAEKLPSLKPFAAEMLWYGISRVPGDFGAAALFALGPIVATHYLPMKQVSYLLLGSSMLLVAGYTAGPLSTVLLSKFSMMLGRNQMADVRKSLQYMMAAVIELSLFTALELIVFADALVHLWVGDQYSPAITLVRLLILAVPPYLFFMALRSGIDAITVKPLNAMNIMIALAFYLVILAAVLNTMPPALLLNAIALSMIASLALLGMLTARTFRNLYGLKVPWAHCLPVLAIGCLLGGLCFAGRWMLGFKEGLVECALMMLLSSGLFVVALLKLRTPWLGFVWNNAFPHRKVNWFISRRPSS
ncbi:MAG TPA: lipopolysaccharide biosynthesis protein [Terriglobia bacterium]|nr:lipopolysaccharide biosynthesis protein [Terriglobia bacterium]